MAEISGEEIVKKYHDIGHIEIQPESISLSIDGKAYRFKFSEISQRLANASEIEKSTFEISPSGYGIHWPLIDEDLSVDGLLNVSHQRPSLKQAALS